MATATEVRGRDRMVLYDVPWSVYVALRDLRANWHVRMSYDDGRLELMSPLYRHARCAGLLGKVVLAVTGVLGIPCVESRDTTFRREGEGPLGGKGKEADTSFYLANERSVRGKDQIDLETDPPPDLAIEVDETTDSGPKLPIYAALGVPEVWIYDTESESLRFLHLGPDGTYDARDRSPGLPMLTPAIVLDWLGRGEGMSDSEWFMQLLDWVRREIPPGGAARRDGGAPPPGEGG